MAILTNLGNEVVGSEGKLDVVGFGCNVASEPSVQKTFEDVVAHFGRVDAVVASAGSFELLIYPFISASILFAPTSFLLSIQFLVTLSTR